MPLLKKNRGYSEVETLEDGSVRYRVYGDDGINIGPNGVFFDKVVAADEGEAAHAAARAEMEEHETRLAGGVVSADETPPEAAAEEPEPEAPAEEAEAERASPEGSS